MPKAASSSLTAATFAGLIFLTIQVSAVLSHFVAQERLFYFTPFSGQTSFRLNVTVGDQALTTAQIRKRYRLPFRGRADLSPEALQAIIVHHETIYAPGSPVFVRMHFSSQRRPEQIWLWPQQ